MGNLFEYIQLNGEVWRIIFKACFKTIENNNYIWFQYRVIFRILGTQKYLFTTKIADFPTCRLCNNEVEDLKHLFIECPKSQNLFQELCNWIINMLQIPFDLTPLTILLGYTLLDSDFVPINTILTITKKYIFNCALYKTSLNIFNLQKKIYKIYQEQETVSILNNKHDSFQKHWLRFKKLFTIFDGD